MALITFSLAFNPKTKELVYRSNILPPEAQLPVILQLLQNALISASQKPLDEADENGKKQKSKEGKKQKSKEKEVDDKV